MVVSDRMRERARRREPGSSRIFLLPLNRSILENGCVVPEPKTTIASTMGRCAQPLHSGRSRGSISCTAMNRRTYRGVPLVWLSRAEADSRRVERQREAPQVAARGQGPGRAGCTRSGARHTVSSLELLGRA